MYRPKYVTEWDGIFHVLAGMPELLVDTYLARCGFSRVEGHRAFSNGQIVVSLVGCGDIWSSPGWRLVGQAPERFFVLRRIGVRQPRTVPDHALS
ncbi:hypothetical protein [Arenibaculum pallidiluteum]|uniref:hypothetical protein n=1 Tax=Arenibaculum pallidiluteum TaxID=2812559 RepID=UPI001A959952|nr:hypothetical protein [Arenibaculum pallidiluteum]